MDSCINTPMKYQIDIISVFVMLGSLIWHICNSTKGFPDPLPSGTRPTTLMDVDACQRHHPGNLC